MSTVLEPGIREHHTPGIPVEPLEAERRRDIVTAMRAGVPAATYLLAALSLASCYSVSYGPAGYERHGVPLPDLGGSGDGGTAEVIVVQDRELVFDEELRLYRVSELPDLYYSAGWFYRPGDSGWERARGIDGNWIAIAATETPPTLLRLMDDPGES